MSLDESYVQPTTSQATYGVPLNKNDENDSFDELALLERVPKRHQSNARKLLQVFDDHPEDITWNSSGVLFIDDIAIPNSDIRLIFPHLFEGQIDSSFDIKGLQELILKIQLMGLERFISKRHKTKIVKVQDLSSDESDSDSTPWYYVGL